MLTRMTEEDWEIAVEVFRAVRSQARRAWPRRSEISGGAALLHRAQHHVARAAARVRQLEQRVEAVLAAEPDGHLRGVLRGAGGTEQERASGADVRLHDRAGACVRGGRKRGQETQALGRSRGGFSTKIHLKTDMDGHPIAFHLTGGEASDSRNFETLLDIGPDIAPRAAVADKGYDAKANREAARERGICPVIPYRQNAKDRPKFFAKALYRGGRASSRPSASSNASSASLCAARRPHRTTRHSSPWPAASP